MCDILDAFTKLVAYLGDEKAKDGYLKEYNNNGEPQYSIDIRENAVSMQYVNLLVKAIKKCLTAGSPLKGRIVADIRTKIEDFIELANKCPKAEKDELLEYIAEYNAENIEQGGARTLRRSLKRRHRSTRKQGRGKIYKN